MNQTKFNVPKGTKVEQKLDFHCRTCGVKMYSKYVDVNTNVDTEKGECKKCKKLSDRDLKDFYNYCRSKN